MREPSQITRRAAAALPLAALVRPASAARPTAAISPDPVLDQIDHHRALRLAVARSSGLDDDPAYVTACDAEEAALQALGDVVPATITGAAALLAYIAEVEGCYADPGSPLLRTVLTVARSLGSMARTTA